MKQNWFFVFSETSIFKKRYIKFHGTREECGMNLQFWHLSCIVVAILSEKDFEAQDFIKRGYKELNIEII